MKKAKQWICLILAVFSVCGAVLGMLTQAQQEQLAAKTVRLHVRANSDSETDRNTKLLVRDAVLAEAAVLTEDCQSADDALTALAAGLPRLADTAAKRLRSLGSGDAVRVSLQNEVFPTRVYDTFRLPAGEYPALRVDIGKAAGHNWWCVIFPTLCMSATTEGMEQTAAAAGFSENELALMTGCTPQVTVKFRLLEWLSALQLH